MVRVKKSSKENSSCELPPASRDAAERKRLLNVLAQRRYRRRKREELLDLKKKASTTTTSSPQDYVNLDTPSQQPECSNVEAVPSMFPDHQAHIFSSSDSPTGQSYYFQDPTDLNLEPLINSHNDSVDGMESRSQTTTESSMVEASFGTPTSVGSLSFPDEAYLPMLELRLLRGCMAIAKRLNIEALVWDLGAISPFTQSSQLDFNHLPLNLQPTFTQLTVQHHPAFDLMPWPNVRDKLILIFSQPPDLRPPMASSPTAFVDFVYDMEDSAEGFRIWGDDPYASETWEIGQKVFERWWWLFDSHTIWQSNTLRKQRGARLLGSVIGEVS